MAITANAIGQIAGAGDRQALMLKVFSGEVLEAFEKRNIALPTITVKTISGAKSFQFPVVGRLSDTDVVSHTPGEVISTQVTQSNERIISIEGVQYTAMLVDDFEEKLLHYDIRSRLAKGMGEALATKVDKRVFAEVYNASRGTGMAGQPNGFYVANTGITGGATPAAKGDALVEALFAANTKMDENDVVGERIFITTPQNFYNLVQSSKAVNADFTSGNGGIDEGKVYRVAGIPIQVSNHLPNVIANGSIGAGANILQGLFYTPDAVGCVKLMDIMTEANWQEDRFATLLTARYAMGFGLLNPGCAGAILSAVPA